MTSPRAAPTIGIVPKCCCLLGFAVGLSVAIAPVRAGGQAPPGAASAALEARLIAGVAAGERLVSRKALRRFYDARARRFAWGDGDRLSPQVYALLAALRTADREGLRPAEYHLAAIDALLSLPPSADPQSDPAARGLTGAAGADLDVLLSDAFFLYASHLTRGRVEPTTVGPEWNIAGRERDLVSLLGASLEQGRLASAIATLPPQREDYRLLRDALAAMRATVAAGGWPPVPGGAALRQGDRGPRVESLRRRLAASNDLSPGAEASGELFDAALADALRSFQARHGLETDAVAGRMTLDELNTPALRRLRQIEANLERLRWLPERFGPRLLRVNIPDFRLTLTEPGTPELAMRVIAGTRARRTPFFTGEITRVILNPDWTVPARIALEDKYPQILENRDFFSDHGFKVFERSGPGWREIDPADVDWIRLPRARFPYLLRQEPGPQNALGRIKFQIPNRHDIYLHDTPSRELFAHAGRAFSSGCIRVERALDLAVRLLGDSPGWTRARIEQTIEAGATVSVPLKEPFPVYLLYATAWVDQDGVLQLREDIYGRDRALIEALSQPLAFQ